MAMQTTTTRDELIGLAVLTAVAGGGLILLALGKGSSAGGGGFPSQYGTIYGVTVPGAPSTAALAVDATGANGGATHLTIPTPIVDYAGPGVDMYTYAQIKQVVNGSVRTVWGSGVAGVHVGPPNPGATSARASYPLVSAQEPQPCNASPAAQLTLIPWPGNFFYCGGTCGQGATNGNEVCTPGTDPYFPNTWATPGTGICGAPPTRGIKGDLHIQIYGNAQANTQAGRSCPGDADGFSSPTCNRRCLWYEIILPTQISFV